MQISLDAHQCVLQGRSPGLRNLLAVKHKCMSVSHKACPLRTRRAELCFRPSACTFRGRLACRAARSRNPGWAARCSLLVQTSALAGDWAQHDASCPQPGTQDSSWLKKGCRGLLGIGLLTAAGLIAAARPANANPRGDGSPQGLTATPATHATADAKSQWFSAGPISDAERLAAAAERNQAASTSTSSVVGTPRWRDTGIELAKGKEKDDDGVTMTVKESDKYYLKEFGEDPRYEKLFVAPKKPKKIDVLESRVPDPNAWDSPEFGPMTAWRTDRMKDMTYSQLWLLIKERRVDQVKFSNDSKIVTVTTKDNAPGGRRTERVALPYDPDLYNHMIEHGVRVQVPDPHFFLDNVIFGCIYLVWPVIVTIIIFMSTMNMSWAPSGNEEKLFKGARLDRMDKGRNRLSFKDIAGIDDVKAEVEELVAFLKDPNRFINLGARAPAGVLLVGNPGTGKTLLARAIAGEAGVPFLSVAGTEFDQLFVGIGASRVRDMFRQARESAPCILFIDEFDGIGKQRSLTAANESANTLNSLLTELDGFEDNSGVIVMAATNRPAALDSALTRPGRFDRLIQLPLPSIDGREAILRVHARDKRVAPEADFNKIARATGGYTGAQLMAVMNTAAITAVRRGSTLITTDDMLTALENLQQESFEAGEDIPEEEEAAPYVRRSIALYEAARTLLAIITPDFDEVAKVVVCPGGRAKGYTYFIPQEEHLESRIITRAYMEAKLTVSLAGRSAERLLLGEAHISTSGASDLEYANIVAREMVYKCGFSRRLGPVTLMDSTSGFLRGQSVNHMSDVGTEITAIAMADISEFLEAAEAKASFGLAVNYKALEALVDALVEKEVLTGEQVTEILEANQVVYFPDPFLEGFGYDEDGKLDYPNRVQEEVDEQVALQQEEEVSAGDDKASHFRIRPDLPPYPYRVRDDLKDLIGDELAVLERL